jgi:hypothetical protein
MASKMSRYVLGIPSMLVELFRHRGHRGRAMPIADEERVNKQFERRTSHFSHSTHFDRLEMRFTELESFGESAAWTCKAKQTSLNALGPFLSDVQRVRGPRERFRQVFCPQDIRKIASEMRRKSTCKSVQSKLSRTGLMSEIGPTTNTTQTRHGGIKPLSHIRTDLGGGEELVTTIIFYGNRITTQPEPISHCRNASRQIYFHHFVFVRSSDASPVCYSKERYDPPTRKCSSITVSSSQPKQRGQAPSYLRKLLRYNGSALLTISRRCTT